MTEKKAHGQIRQGQLITTYGPGALIDLPKDSAIIGGLETWPQKKDLDQITEPRLTDKLRVMTGVLAPELYAPPPARTDPGAPNVGIRVWRFPEWFVVHEDSVSAEKERSRRLVHRKSLDEKGRFDGREVVATRFVRACPKGHIDDLDWWRFVHGEDNNCKRQLWLDEHGTSGDLSELSVRCECGARRNLYEAAERETKPLGFCQGRRPWLGNDSNEDCNQPSRLNEGKVLSGCRKSRNVFMLMASLVGFAGDEVLEGLDVIGDAGLRFPHFLWGYPTIGRQHTHPLNRRQLC